MKKINSLKGRNLFKEVYNRGIKAQGNGLKIFVVNERRTALTDADPFSGKKKSVHIGITINRRYGNAAERNKAKRRIKCAFGTLIEELNDGVLMIIRVDTNFKNLEFQAIRPALQRLLIKTGAVKK